MSDQHYANSLTSLLWTVTWCKENINLCYSSLFSHHYGGTV